MGTEHARREYPVPIFNGAVVRSLGTDQRGATAIEYGLISALIAVVVIAAVASLGDPVNGMFGGIVDHFTTINDGQAFED